MRYNEVEVWARHWKCVLTRFECDNCKAVEYLYRAHGGNYAIPQTFHYAPSGLKLCPACMQQELAKLWKEQVSDD